MKYFLFILLLQITDQVVGQSKRDLILTKKENYIWIEELEPLELTEKLLKIKERILMDTNTVFNECCVDGLIWTKPEGKEIGECKPTINIGSTIFHFTNDVKVPTILEFVNMLSPKKIKNIRIYTDKDKDIYAVYGLTSECGIIIMDPKNKRIKRKFDKLQHY